MLCVDLGYDVYDYMPDSRASYPFVFIGEQFQQDNRKQKDYLNGRTQVTVHVWHNDPYKRGSFVRMMDNIETKVRRHYKADLANVTSQKLNDNSTSQDLLHGVLEFDINF